MNEHTGDRGRISVFVVDDHEIFRRGIRALLALEPDIDVVGETESASSALARMPAVRPDVALLDVRLPDGDGISVCREIRSALPETACLMLAGYGDDQALLGAIVAGAAGYVSKQTCGTDLVSAMRKRRFRPVRTRPAGASSGHGPAAPAHLKRGPGGGADRTGEAGA